jgi:hypothetical protein
MLDGVRPTTEANPRLEILSYQMVQTRRTTLTWPIICYAFQRQCMCTRHTLETYHRVDVSSRCRVWWTQTDTGCAFKGWYYVALLLISSKPSDVHFKGFWRQRIMGLLGCFHPLILKNYYNVTDIWIRSLPSKSGWTLPTFMRRKESSNKRYVHLWMPDIGQSLQTE